MIQKTTVQDVKILGRPNLRETLKKLPIGIPQRFSIRDFKVQPARQAISELRQTKKYDFTITEKDMIDEYIVTRIK